MVGDGGLHRPFRHQAALVDQPPQQLGVVDDLVVAAQVGVLAGQGVEAVGAGGDRLPWPRPRRGLDVLLGLELVQVLVAEPAGQVAGAETRGGRARRSAPRPGAAGRRPPWPCPWPGPRGGRAADPVQVLDVVGEPVGDDGDLEAEALGPGQALAGPSPRGRPSSRRCAAWCRPRRGSGTPSGPRSGAAPEWCRRARCRPGTARRRPRRWCRTRGRRPPPPPGPGPCRARPGRGVRGSRGSPRRAGTGLLEQVVAQVGDDQLGRQRLAGVPGQALVRQRPHSVQVARSSSCLKFRSSTLPAPNTSSSVISSGSIWGGQRPQGLGAAGEGDVEQAVKMCRCLEYMTSTRARHDRQVGEQEAVVEQRRVEGRGRQQPPHGRGGERPAVVGEGAPGRPGPR